MQVQSIMRRNLVTVRRDDSMSLALQQMLWAGVRHLPVMDGDELVGVLTERDVLRFRAEHPQDAMSRPVADAMTRNIHSVDPEESVEVAGLRMAEEHVGCLPVCKRGQLVGMLTTTDVLTHGAQQL